MKTKEELNALKEEVETENEKLHALTEEELAQVSGGGEVDNAKYLCYYDETIKLYRTSWGAYLLFDPLTGNERIVEDAKDLEDVACELKKIR